MECRHRSRCDGRSKLETISEISGLWCIPTNPTLTQAATRDPAAFPGSPGLGMLTETNPDQAGSRPILVTGAHRSGSTWVGRMIARSPTIRYIHEPFNPDAFKPGICAARFEREFTYVCAENAA